MKSAQNFSRTDQYSNFWKGTRFPRWTSGKGSWVGTFKEKRYVLTLEIGEILQSWETNLRENMLVKLGDNTFCLMQ